MKEPDKYKPNKIYVIASAVVIIAVVILARMCNAPDVNDVNSLAKADSLKIFKNKYNEEVAQNVLILSQRDAFKKMYFAKDADYKRLQDIVDKNTIGATIIKNNTSFNNSVKTEIKWDTVKLDGEKVYPTYKRTFKNKWIADTIVADKDSVKLNIVVYNEYEVIQKWERPKWYKAKQPTIEVTNKNPYTQTVALKSFALKPPKPKRWAFFTAGLIVGAGAFIYFNK